MNIRKVFEKASLREDAFVYIVMAGAVLFYLPFLSRQFIGDDWLWLSNAKRALTDPIVFLQRPMYGYFRPLNMVIVFLWSHILGVNAPLFSLVNMFLHAGNVFLLGKVLDRLGVERMTRNLAVLIFAFYFLNSPAIEWISVGHDLWVTGLCLVFVLRLLKFIEQPRTATFLQLSFIGLAATLIKESGFVTLGIFFVVLLLKRKSPLAKEYRGYSLVLTAAYLAFLIAYSATGNVVDREVNLGSGTFISLWYFLAYIVFPLAKRIAEAVPSEWSWVLQPLRVGVTLLLPVAAIYIWRKGGLAGRFFLSWSAMFVATMAIMFGHVGLFDLYPPRVVTRYVYTATVGYAACLAVVIGSLIGRRFNGQVAGRLFLLFATLYVGANFFIVRATSQVYFENQRIHQEIVKGLRSVGNQLAESDTLLVLTDDLAKTPQTITLPGILAAVVHVTLDKKIIVQVVEQRAPSENLTRQYGRLLTLRWSTSLQRFEPI